MNGWKVTAIIFIVVSILELLFVAWAWNVATDMIDQENECIYNVCDLTYDTSYIYYQYEEVCECYNSFGELTKSEYLGGLLK